MKDILSILEAEKARAQELIANTFGSSVDVQRFPEVVQSLFPDSFRDLQQLCIFYENEMFRCRDAGANFSACLSGAAMIESFLLALCILEKEAVERTVAFSPFSKSGKQYDEIILGWTLKHLIAITEELQWIRHTVDADLVTALISVHQELAPVVKPGITAKEISDGITAIRANPDSAFLGLMQNMRNLVHAGRCARLKKNVASSDFAEWAKLVTILTVDIRDCLILQLKSSYQKYLSTIVSSPSDAIMLIRKLGIVQNIYSLKNP